MENLNVNPANSEIENPISESLKVKVSQNSEKGKKLIAKKKAIDSVNFDKVKISLSKNKDLLTKEKSATSSKEIYKGMSEMSTDEKKKFRGKIRRTLRNFVNQILGKDRNEKERIEGIKDFLKFYKENWKINDFKIENFSLSQNASDKKDYVNLLKYVKDSLS